MTLERFVVGQRRGCSAILGLALVAVLLGATPSGAQPRGTPPPSTPYLRWKYFHDQRAYPNTSIPPGAMQRAREEYLQQWPPPPPAAAPQIGGNVWSSIGPTQITTLGTLTPVGRVAAVAVHPTDSNTVYIGGAQGGVWKTTNGGTSWTPLTDDQCSLAMGAIAIDPVNPNIVYAGTGEEHFSVDSYYGCGVLKSTDAGATWTRVGAAAFATSSRGATIARLIIDPATAGSTTATVLLAATSLGIYRSVDSGTSWTQTLAGIGTDILFDPSNSATVYAAIGNPGGDASNGIYKSTNGGVGWTQLTGFNPGSVGRINLALAASAPNTLYAAVQHSSTSQLRGIFKTTNGGTSWTQSSATNASCGGQCWYDMIIAVHPSDPNTVYFGGVSLYKSTDGGTNFTNILDSIHVDQHAFAFDPGSPSTIYVGNDGGVYRSTNGGTSWASLNTNLAITQFTQGISLHPTDATIAYGGTQDNGTLRYSGTLTWTDVLCDLLSFLCADGGYTAIDFTNPTTVYAETQWTPNSSYSGPQRTDGILASAFTRKVNGINTGESAQFYPPLVMSPSDPTRLYFGTCRVYQTTDQGENWTGLTSSCTWSGTVTAIAEAPSNAQVIYAGTSNGQVQATTNGGATWTLVTTGLPLRFVTALAVHPTVPATAFVTLSGFGTGHVFKTTTTGASWTDISGNLPNIPVNAILLDPGDPANTIYIGTDLGVFKTSDGGTTWAPFNNGMPNVAVFDLAYRPAAGVLIAATHGRGMFKFAASTALSVTPSSLNFGSVTVNTPADLSFTIQNVGGGTLTGTATASGAPFSIVAGGSFSLAANATRAVTVRCSPTSGTLFTGNISFTSNGGNASRAVTCTGVAAGSTTTTLASSVNPSVLGQPVTFTATVNVTAGTGTPTGTVKFFDGATELSPSGTLNASRQATLTTNALAVGSHSLTAKYMGDASFNTSTSATLTQTITKAPTATSVTSSANPSSVGQAVTFTATVDVVSPGAGTPAGSVTFFDGGSALGPAVTLNVLRQATLTTGSGGGTGIVTATYDSTLKAPKCSTANSGCDSGTLLTGRDSVAPSEPNQPNTINNSCTDGTQGTFHSDESVDRIRVSTVDGTTLAPGKTARIDVDVWAYAAGPTDQLDLYYTASASSPTWVFIATLNPTQTGANTLSTTYTLPTGSPQAVRANFRFRGSASACGANSGYDDRDDLIFTVGDIALAAGLHSITGQYAGNANFNGSTSAPLTQCVGTGCANVTLTVTKHGTGTGAVTGGPISCGNTCSASVTGGSTVTLTAAPDSGSTFTGWSGGGCSGTGTCPVTVTAATTVNANFSKTLTDPGLGPGTVIRAAHITDLRTAINTLRQAWGLPLVSWAESVTAGVPVKAAHVTELRTALDAVYTQAGATHTAYADSPLGAGATIKAVHITELRSYAAASPVTTTPQPFDR